MRSEIKRSTVRLDKLLADHVAAHESGFGTSRKWRHVRLESAMRSMTNCPPGYAATRMTILPKCAPEAMYLYAA